MRDYLEELPDDDETFTEEEARRHYEARLLLPDDPSAISWLEPETPTPTAAVKAAEGAYEDMRSLAFHLVAHRQAEAYEHLTKAALALAEGDVDVTVAEVEIAKASIPGSLVQGIIQNLFSSLAQMLETTVQQFRGATNPLSVTGSLIPSLGLATGPSLAGWPTL